MLAPLRDYFRPKYLASSALLGATKEQYFSQLSARVYPGEPGFEESQWITSEDVNVEHLLDVFISIDVDSRIVWDACAGFINHLNLHKPRLITLGPRIEALLDDHPSKAPCLQALILLFRSVENLAECKRLLTHNLKLWRERGNDVQVAVTLGGLADVNQYTGHCKEGLNRSRKHQKSLNGLVIRRVKRGV